MTGGHRQGPAPAFLRFLLAFGLAVLVSGCSDRVPVTLKGETFAVELALDDAARARGLMFRDHMEPGHGMLFVFPDESYRAFWMKNTKIPLDILYFDSDRRFVSGQYNVPTCSAGDRCPNYPSEGPAKYVLELNAGVGRKLGLVAGDVIGIPDGLASRD